MRSYQKQDQFNFHTSKTKKIMEYANLISQKTKNNNKSKVKNNYSKQANMNKEYNNFDLKYHSKLQQTKDQINKSRMNEFTLNFLNLNKIKEVQKSQSKGHHYRSKTQNFKPKNQSFIQDLFQDQIMVSKQSNLKPNEKLKKSQTKRKLNSQSSKRLKSQSCKVLNMQYSSLKSGQIKYTSNMIIRPNSNDNKPNNQKMQHKKRTNNPETTEKYISNLNKGLDSLKLKFKKQQLRNKSSDKSKNKINKQQKISNQQNINSKNMTLSNLSQILQRNENQFSGQYYNSNQSEILRKQIQSKKNLKLQQMYSNLQKKISYITSTIQERIIQKQQCKGKKKSKNRHEDNDNNVFLFSKKLNPSGKYGRSNFQTGVDNQGIDHELKKMLKLKLHTQMQVNSQISNDLLKLKDYYQSQSQHLIPLTSRVQIKKQFNQEEQNSARTFRQKLQINSKEDSSEFNNERNQNVKEKHKLTELLLKYNKMTNKIIPFVSELNEKQINKSEDISQNNKRIISKFNDLTQKNLKYQKVINLLINDGIDVQKYMKNYVLGKKQPINSLI